LKNKEIINQIDRIEMKKGDIIRADDFPKHPHPIVFLKDNRDGSFDACIITHEQGKGNIKLEQEHFQTIDEKKIPFSIQYDDSYLVYKRLCKEDSWIKNETVKGKLTEEGIKFVESNIPLMSERKDNAIWDW
jgi:hypothetical protein